jgi:hypothetical protein
MPRKNVKDQLRAIQNPAGQCCFKVSQLCRGQVVIEEHQVGVGRRSHTGNLFYFACAHQGCRIGSRPPLQQLGHYLRTCAAHQLAKLFERFLGAKDGAELRLVRLLRSCSIGSVFDVGKRSKAGALLPGAASRAMDPELHTDQNRALAISLLVCRPRARILNRR